MSSRCKRPFVGQLKRVQPLVPARARILLCQNRLLPRMDAGIFFFRMGAADAAGSIATPTTTSGPTRRAAARRGRGRLRAFRLTLSLSLSCRARTLGPRSRRRLSLSLSLSPLFSLRVCLYIS